MVSIRRQLTVMFFGCASLTAILIYYFVNVTICSQIDEYMMEIRKNVMNAWSPILKIIIRKISSSHLMQVPN